jgi:hypothetical protein
MTLFDQVFPSNVLDPSVDVTILSTNQWPNFGDRLGFHLVPRIIPAGVPVKYLFRPIIAPHRSSVHSPRMLVLYLGSSVFHPLLTSNLLQFVNSFDIKIGIFGTQYRHALNRDLLLELINSLTIWCARYKEDLEFCSYPGNSVHFGDWLIDLFPLTRPRLKSTLSIPANIMHDTEPLDRTIENIQKYSHVHSCRLHPLLCALTSADTFSYEEQREFADSAVSGKFHSMFLDIFGQTYPEHETIAFERNAVIRYKQFVRGNIELLSSAIERLYRH